MVEKTCHFCTFLKSIISTPGGHPKQCPTCHQTIPGSRKPDTLKTDCVIRGQRELEPCECYTTAPRALLQAMWEVMDGELRRQSKMTCTDETVVYLKEQLEDELRRLGDDERFRPVVWLESQDAFFTLRPRDE